MTNTTLARLTRADALLVELAASTPGSSALAELRSHLTAIRAELGGIPHDEAELRRLYVDEGQSVSEIAQRFGCSVSTVTATMDRVGIARRPRGPRKLFEVRGMGEDGAALTGFYGAGRSREEAEPWIARMFTRKDVVTVELWVSNEAAIEARDPKRKLVETVSRERRAA